MSNTLRHAYESIYALLGADVEDHFIFTSSGAEGVNHVLFATFLDVTRQEGKNHFLTATTAEAPQILGMARFDELLCTHTLLPVDSSGQITPEAVQGALTPRTALLSLSTACALTGVIQRHLKAIGTLCKERGVIFHLDVTHTLSSAPFSWEDTCADILTFHGEGIGAPAGTGGLVMRAGVEMSPFIVGDTHQGGMRAGSFHALLLLELGRVSAECLGKRVSKQTEGAFLRMRFEEGLKKRIEGCQVLFEEEERIPEVSLLNFDGIYGESLQALLNRRHIVTTIGGGNLQRLPGLLASHKKSGHSALSFRIPPREELESQIETIAECVTHLRRYVEAL